MIYKDFEYKITNDEVIITNYIGNETDVIIPAEIEEFKVTHIWDCAFYNCSFLTSITIPNSVTHIGRGAFAWCSSLTNVEIPDSVTNIGNSAFWCCSSLMSINIPSSVTNIERESFWGCSSLTDITIPNSLIKIGKNAFSNCNSLKSKANYYKAFRIKNNKLICMNDCEFKENEWSDNIDNLELRRRGYHFCTNLFEVFNYYSGRLDKDITIYECEVGDIVIKSDKSKCVTNTIKPVKRLHREDVIRILNNIK